MAEAFQGTAFQNDAFQTDGAVPPGPTPPDRWHYARRRTGAFVQWWKRPVIARQILGRARR
jgi:hypothetical protein